MSVAAGNVGFVTKDPGQPEQPEESAAVTEPAPEAPAKAPLPLPQPVPEPVDTGYTSAGVPTFESVREKIENRYGTAIGASELAGETPEGRAVEEQYEERQQAAAERLEQIRKSMRDPDSDGEQP